MVVRYSGGVYTDIIRFHTPFLLMVYTPTQMDGTSTLTIKPTWVDPEVNLMKYLSEDVFPELDIIETTHLESFDFALSFDIDYGEYYNHDSEEYFPLILAVGENGKLIDTSYGKCYCLETIMELVASVDINLLEPTSKSKS
jgi:hypothetical protein